MKSNPFTHAIGASVYILLINFLFKYLNTLGHNKPDHFLSPMLAISLLTFSAAVMAFLFFYKPVTLLIENKKQEAISFFLKTLGIFGAITLIVLAFVSLQ